MTDRPEAEKLEPCPFCGDTMEDRGYGAMHVDGKDCPIGGYAFDVAAWSRRVPAKPVADAGGVREDDVIGLINIVTDLAEVDALDKAYPEVWGRLDAMVNHAVAAATAAKDAILANPTPAMKAAGAAVVGSHDLAHECWSQMLRAALSEAREAGDGGL